MANFYTFTQAATELQYRIGNRTDLGSGSQDRINLWLNSAQLKIASCSIDCPTLDIVGFPMTTVADQTEYGLLSILPPATNIIGIKLFRNDSQGVKMIRFPWTEYRSLNQQAQDSPLRWARDGYTVALDPQPDDVYSLLIDYRREPQLAVSELPNWLQDDWITVAEWIAWKALLKPERAQAAFGLLSRQLQVLMSQPMDQAQWEASQDTELGIRPVGFDYPYLIGG